MFLRYCPIAQRLTIWDKLSFSLRIVPLIIHIQFLNEIWDFVPLEDTYYSMRGAWTLQVVLAINLKCAHKKGK